MAYEYDRFDDESSGGGAFVMGLIAGAVLGVGVGMLLAPKSGSELRNQLGDTASRLRDRAAEGYSTASSRVADMYNRKTGSTGSEFQSTSSYTGGTAGTSGFATGGADTPTTNSEF